MYKYVENTILNKMWYDVVLNTLSFNKPSIDTDISIIDNLKNDISDNYLISRLLQECHFSVLNEFKHILGFEFPENVIKLELLLFSSLLKNQREIIELENSDEVIDGIVNYFKRIITQVIQKEISEKSLFSKLLLHYTKKDTSIYKLYKMKIDIINLFLDKEIMSQADLRKQLLIPISDRSNFKKTHLLPLINASIIKECHSSHSKKPFYVLTDKFKNEIKKLRKNYLSHQLSKDLYEFSNISEIDTEQNISNETISELLNF